MGKTFLKSFLFCIIVACFIAMNAKFPNNKSSHLLGYINTNLDNILISYTNLSSNSDYIYGDATHIPVALPDTQKQGEGDITKSPYHQDNSKPESQLKDNTPNLSIEYSKYFIDKNFKNKWSNNLVLLEKVACKQNSVRENFSLITTQNYC